MVKKTCLFSCDVSFSKVILYGKNFNMLPRGKHADDTPARVMVNSPDTIEHIETDSTIQRTHSFFALLERYRAHAFQVSRGRRARRFLEHSLIVLPQKAVLIDVFLWNLISLFRPTSCGPNSRIRHPRAVCSARMRALTGDSLLASIAINHLHTRPHEVADERRE